jgi:hypothetical protein
LDQKLDKHGDRQIAEKIVAQISWFCLATRKRSGDFGKP